MYESFRILITGYNVGEVVQTSEARMNKNAVQDFALRTLIVLAGVVAAALLILKGQAEALPALAVGATLGTVAMSRFGPSEE
jgi:hypothetical protein